MGIKINTLDTHDRFLSFQRQNFQLSDCVQDLINKKPFGPHPFYIFCHPRTDDDGTTKRYIWSPWIWKPRAQTNSALYKAYPGSDVIKVIWIIPPREMWDVYKKGTMFENELIVQSTWLFDNDRERLQCPESDDPTPEKAQEIVFEHQPQLFKRDSLPDELKSEWDKKMSELAKQRNVAQSQAASYSQGDTPPYQSL